MRVLLFVQTGDGRPKCVKQFGARVAWARQYFAKIRFGEPGQPERGWLVECETADEGRWTLLKAGFVRGPLFPTKFREGRILAQGGKA